MTCSPLSLYVGEGYGERDDDVSAGVEEEAQATKGLDEKTPWNSLLCGTFIWTEGSLPQSVL